MERCCMSRANGRFECDHGVCCLMELCRGKDRNALVMECSSCQFWSLTSIAT